MRRMAYLLVGAFVTLLGFGAAKAATEHPVKLIPPAVQYRGEPQMEIEE